MHRHDHMLLHPHDPVTVTCSQLAPPHSAYISSSPPLPADCPKAAVIKMARSSFAPALVVVAVMLLGAVQAQTTSKNVHDQCMSYFGGLGKEGIVDAVPTCQQGMRGFRGCCQETKDLVNKAPQGCLCEDDVWEELVEKIEGAGFNGLNRDTLNLFANLCGIPHSGNGQCRRMARAKARSGGRTSTRSTVRRTSGSTHN